MRGWYNKKSTEERREYVSKRDNEITRKNGRRRYYRDRKKRLEAAKKWQTENPEKKRLSVEKWGENNKEKRKCHYKVKAAIRNGSLIKTPCQECGETKVHAHHVGYEKPLDVQWLCSKHHGEAHRLYPIPSLA